MSVGVEQLLPGRRVRHVAARGLVRREKVEQRVGELLDAVVQQHVAALVRLRTHETHRLRTALRAARQRPELSKQACDKA
eukprot:5320583-Pleurochrysis_carterae.AAC.2